MSSDSPKLPPSFWTRKQQALSVTTNHLSYQIPDSPANKEILKIAKIEDLNVPGKQQYIKPSVSFPPFSISWWNEKKTSFSYSISILFVIINISFNFTPLLKTLDANGLMNQTNRVVALVSQQSPTLASTQERVDFSYLSNIDQPGPFTWSKETLLLNDSRRASRFISDIYLPKVDHNAPVIVISHGLSEKRTNFAYLAQQLASYGFAVAIPEHSGIHLHKVVSLLKNFIYGTTNNKDAEPKEFINRALNVKFLLDELYRRSQSDPSFKVNLKQVGVIGHSFGGYTALALAGATLNFSQLRQDCANIASNVFTSSLLNLSLLLQCRALELPDIDYDLKDERIKAVMVINPVSSSIFGQAGMSQIQVPVMFISGSNDMITPALMEQFLPFTWLTTAQKYLVTIQGSNHFSTVGKNNPSRNPLIALACRYVNVLGVAFFQTHVAQAKQYQPYLSASYVQTISQEPFKLSLVPSLTKTQLELALKDNNRTTTSYTHMGNGVYWSIVPIYENFRDYFKA